MKRNVTEVPAKKSNGRSNETVLVFRVGSFAQYFVSRIRVSPGEMRALSLCYLRVDDDRADAHRKEQDSQIGDRIAEELHRAL